MADEENKAVSTEAEKKAAAPIDPTAFMQGWLVGSRIAAMRGKSREEA